MRSWSRRPCPVCVCTCAFWLLGFALFPGACPGGAPGDANYAPGNREWCIVRTQRQKSGFHGGALSRHSTKAIRGGGAGLSVVGGPCRRLSCHLALSCPWSCLLTGPCPCLWHYPGTPSAVGALLLVSSCLGRPCCLRGSVIGRELHFRLLGPLRPPLGALRKQSTSSRCRTLVPSKPCCVFGGGWECSFASRSPGLRVW